ncbi:MAG: hypothetical protein WBA74_01535 [Cyclobacteriaceae bacterium]
MIENVGSNMLIWQSVYMTSIALFCVVIYLIFLFHTKQIKRKRGDLFFQITRQKKGEYEWSLHTQEAITKEQAEKVIRQVLDEAIKNDPALVRLLFVTSLEALEKDPAVSSMFKEKTGNSLSDRLNESPDD